MKLTESKMGAINRTYYLTWTEVTKQIPERRRESKFLHDDRLIKQLTREQRIFFQQQLTREDSMKRFYSVTQNTLAVTIMVALISMASAPKQYCFAGEKNRIKDNSKFARQSFAEGMIDKFKAALCENEINVPGDFDTIQEAIDSVCIGNTVIKVSGGPYNESIQIIGKRNIFLLGEGATAINGSNQEGNVITVDDSSVRIEGFLISGGATGILSQASNVICENIVCERNFDGFKALLGSNIRLIGACKMVNNTNAGLRFGHSSSGTVQTCEISGNGFRGIQMGGGSRLILEDSIVRDNDRGGIFLCEGSSLHSFGGNVIEQNGSQGIMMNSGANLWIGTPTKKDVIKWNNFGGIFARGGNILFQTCEVSENAGHGIFISSYATFFPGGADQLPGRYLTVKSNSGYGLFCTSKSAFRGFNVMDLSSNGAGEYCSECIEESY